MSKTPSYRKKDLVEGLVNSGTGNIVRESQAEAVIQNISDQIVLALLSGKSVIIPGVVKLSPILRKGRKGVHPRTREPFNIPPRVSLKLKISTPLRERLQAIRLDPMLGESLEEDEDDGD